MPKLNTFVRHSVAATTALTADQTTAATFSTAPWGSAGSVSFSVFAHVLARQTDSAGETGDYFRTATFKRVSGTLSQVGSTRTVGTDNEDVAGWDVTLDASGDDIRVRVTGDATDTVKWLVDDFTVQVNDNSDAYNVGNGTTFP